MKKSIIILALVIFFVLAISALSAVNYSIKKEVQISKNLDPLPDRYENVYRSIYPDAFLSTTLHHIYSSFWANQDSRKCPCLDMAKFTAENSSKITAINITSILVTALLLESKLSQNECHNYLLNYYYFDKDIKGVHEASKRYFVKSFDLLTTYEYLQIIVMLKNIGLFNKNNGNKRLEDEVLKIERIYKEKETLMDGVEFSGSILGPSANTSGAGANSSSTNNLTSGSGSGSGDSTGIFTSSKDQ